MLRVEGVDLNRRSATDLYPCEAALAAKWLGIHLLAICMHYRFKEGDEFIEELRKQVLPVKGLVMKPGGRFMEFLNA